MRKSFIVFNDQGEILRTGSCPGSMFAIQSEAGENITEGSADDVIQYIDTSLGIPSIANKPALGASIDKTEIVANGTDLATITGLPDNTTVTVDNTTYEVTDGELEFSSDVPGTFEIVCTAARRLSQVFIVEATDAS